VNELTGPFPSELGRLTASTEFASKSNNRTGTLPGELRNLTCLVSFDVSENELRGPIPTEIGLLCVGVTALDLGSDQLMGSLPDEVFRRGTGSLFLKPVDGTIPAMEPGRLRNLRELGRPQQRLGRTHSFRTRRHGGADGPGLGREEPVGRYTHYC
jgi:hypothetical protein